MKTTMRLNRIRIAPRKMRMVVDMVRGKKVAVAKDILRFNKNRGSGILSKLLDSAVASARSLGQGDESNLMVLKITVDEGPKLKRWRARAKGSAYPIQKKVSHITLILNEVKREKAAQESRKLAESPKGIQASSPQSKDLGEETKVEKPKFRAASSVLPRAPKVERGIQRFFRRKVV